MCAAAIAAPTVQALMGFPEVETLSISPDGKYLALTHRRAEHELLTLLRYPEVQAVASSHFGDLIDIHEMHWVDGERLLIQPARRFFGYRAYKVPTGEIIRVDVGSRRSELLFGFRVGEEKMQTGSIMQKKAGTESWAVIIDVQTDDPNTVLIKVGSFDNSGQAVDSQISVQRLNIKTGRISRVAAAPVPGADFFTNARHQLSLAYGETPSGDFESYRFEPQDRSWKLLASSGDSDGQILPLEETGIPGEFIAMDSMTSATRSVIAWQPAAKEQRVLFHSAVSDVWPAGVDPQEHVYVYRYEDHVPEFWYPDPEHPLARVHAALRRQFKDANVRITSQTRDQSLAVAEVSAPRIPRAFYLVDVKAMKLLQMLPAYPSVKPADLSPTDPIELKVRDGITVRGYLTTPNGSSGKNLPLVALVHGGPHGVHDSFDFDPEVQLLASRGYAVLQVNYRGSGGRGRAFESSGYGRWGREMQDDITDAVKWAVAAGVADRSRICIYGGSYGAYAALTGAFREPDLFKCAVGMAGVYDLTLMFEKGDILERASGVAYLRRAIGTDLEELKRRSPVYNADQIKARVMLIHGEDDERAPFEHAVRMRAALQKAGNQPVWIAQGGEDHGVRGEAHRLAAYEQLLAFLARNLGAAATGDGS